MCKPVQKCYCSCNIVLLLSYVSNLKFVCNYFCIFDRWFHKTESFHNIWYFGTHRGWKWGEMLVFSYIEFVLFIIKYYIILFYLKSLMVIPLRALNNNIKTTHQILFILQNAMLQISITNFISRDIQRLQMGVQIQFADGTQ